MLWTIVFLLFLPILTNAANNTVPAPYKAGRMNLCNSHPSCTCSQDYLGLSVFCNRNMKTFPTALPTNVSVLTIQCLSSLDSRGQPIYDGQWFSSIPEKAFSDKPYLTEISISRCPVLKFDPLLFANLPQLTSVSLDSIPISYLNGSLFRQSNSLKQLQLMKMVNLKAADPTLLINKKEFTTLIIKQTDLSGQTMDKLLSPVKLYLKDFTWSHSESDIMIPLRTFQGFRFKTLNLAQNRLINADFLINTRARVLKLSGNPGLATTPPFDFSRCYHLKGLMELHLSFSNLRAIPKDSFKHMNKLQKLYLGNNHLKSVPSDIYTHLSSQLFELDLSNNKIQFFPPKMKPLLQRRLLKVMLRGNPLHCNCEAQWLLDFKDDISELYCDSSPEARKDLRGKLLSSIPTKQLVCVQPSLPKITPTNAGIQIINDWRERASTIGTSSPSDRERAIPYEGGQKTITVSRGQKISLRCVSSGDPAPELKWIFPTGVNLNREATEDRTIFSNEISVSISYEQIKYNRIANFTCQATNLVASRSDYILLKNLHPEVSTARPEGGTTDLQTKVTPQPSIKDRNVACSITPSLGLLLGPLIVCHWLS